MAYREHVDRGMGRLIAEAPAPLFEDLAGRIELGLNHEEQHQELMLTDLKHVLWTNPSRPVYDAGREAGAGPGSRTGGEWVEHSGGVVEVGWEGTGFAFDNEGPRHKVLLQPFAVASRLVTCGEYLEFMTDGGYRRPELWLADGWAKAQASSWNAPLYWERPDEGGWRIYTLAGLRPLDPALPAGHVSFYEADAYARWKGARLPKEEEWELVSGSLSQATDRLWQWTGSPYTPYPGYRPVSGALGEYNGKFMCNQMVLRGGSLATPARHLRPTYRNFFPPEARWQFTGIRLAR
jgi:ergothioneine biosynthesis protein EgtB